MNRWVGGSLAGQSCVHRSARSAETIVFFCYLRKRQATAAAAATAVTRLMSNLALPYQGALSERLMRRHRSGLEAQYLREHGERFCNGHFDQCSAYGDGRGAIFVSAKPRLEGEMWPGRRSCNLSFNSPEKLLLHLARGYGATAARLTPDQKVGSSNLSGLICYCSLFCGCVPRSKDTALMLAISDVTCQPSPPFPLRSAQDARNQCRHLL